MTSKTPLPFIARYSEPLENPPMHKVRYDERRQVSLALVDGEWIDALQAGATLPQTIITKVANETDDDK